MSFAARQLLRSFQRRLPRYFPAILAIAIAAAAIGALGSLASDVARKMTREFRLRGPNAVARSRDGRPLSGDAARRIASAADVERALPIRVSDLAAGSRRVTAIAVDFSRARPFFDAWDLDGALPSSPAEAVAGVRLYDRLGLDRSREVEVALPGGARRVRIVGRVATGEGEDEELILPWSDLPRADSGEADALLLRLAGSGARVAASAARIERDSGARVDPLLAVATSEGRVVVRLRGLLTAMGIAIAGLAALGTATTLMAAVVQRRREIALEKSLGAEGRRLFVRFLAEGAALGAIGGAIGAAAGLLIADRLERHLFGVPLTVSPAWAVIPFLISIGIAAAAGLPSVRRALSIEAITALRNE
ncbi:MAG TPA: ABC transporter permease [Thermoanaerobaculia bacterium]|nr:ABC transporter permease [Thermoanaerobaculia bacterium]